LLVRQALLARNGPQGAVEWYPPGLLTAWLTGLGLAALAAALLLLGGPSGIEALLRESLAPAIDRFVNESEASRGALTAELARVVPGVVAASWMVMTASTAMLAQGLLARFRVSWRPSPDLAALTLPIWVTVVFGVAVTATAMGGAARFLGINVMIVLAIPFCFAALAVLHAAVRRLRRPQIPLVGFYVLAGLLGWPLLVIAVVGLFDALFGLRRRFARP
jgi:Predicted membrane protein (DUF2232)